jgi:hypothetical protein
MRHEPVLTVGQSVGLLTTDYYSDHVCQQHLIVHICVVPY